MRNETQLNLRWVFARF